MNQHANPLDDQHDANDPFGMAKFSIRRSSVQQLLCMLFMHIFLITAGVVSLIQGNWLIFTLSGGAYIALFLQTTIIAINIPRLVEVEVWIRRLGVGDFEHTVEPWGNDEVSKAVIALEALRQNSIRALQLDTVRQLSEELRDRNAELEQALADLRDSQDRIISQQKLAELGELTAGVAHEMRNPLQFIRNFTESSHELSEELQELLSESDDFDREEATEIVNDLVENMERIENHASRLNYIASAMMILDRGTGGGFRPVDLNRMVIEQTDMGHKAIQTYEPGFEAAVNMQLSPTIDEIVVVPEDIARAIINLVMNACESMAERRRLAEGEYSPQLTVSTDSTDDGVVMLVRDNGTGLSQEVKERMFNPFYTTRTTARNTGLGLSLVWDIVREHGGSVAAESMQGEYTELKVVLPTIPGAESIAAAE